MRVFLGYPFEYVIDTSYMVDIQLILLLFKIGGIDIGNRAVAIPFEESQIRILDHDIIHHAEYIILYFRVA